MIKVRFSSGKQFANLRAVAIFKREESILFISILYISMLLHFYNKLTLLSWKKTHKDIKRRLGGRGRTSGI